MIALGPLLIASIFACVVLFASGCNCSGEKGSFVALNLELGLVWFGVMMFFVLGSKAYIARRIRDVPDPLGVNKETLIASVSSPIGLLGVVLTAADVGGYMKMQEAPWSWTWLIDFAFLFHYLFLCPLPVILSFRRQELHIGAEAQFQKLMKDKRGIEKLSQFLATELSLENLLFLVRLREWRQTYEEQSNAEREKVSEEIFNDFVKPNSQHEVNVSGHARYVLSTLFTILF